MLSDHLFILLGAAIGAAAVLLVRWGWRRFRAALAQLDRDLRDHW